MDAEDLNILEVEVKLLDLHWTEILKILVHLPPNERFLKRDQLEWLIKKGQPALRELALENKVQKNQLNEIHGLIDDCMAQMTKAKNELEKLRKLARDSQQFFETLNLMSDRELYEKEFDNMKCSLSNAGYEPVAV